MRTIFAFLFCAIALPAFAVSHKQERYLDQQRVLQELATAGPGSLAKEFTTGCATSPFSTTPSGPQWTATFNTSSTESVRFTAWRKPCSGNDGQLFITITPVNGSPFVCGTRVAVVQNNVQFSSFFFNTSSTGLESLCTDVLVPTTVYLRPSSSSSAFDDDAAMTIFYESGSSQGTIQIAIPAFDPGAYGVTPVNRVLQGGLSGTYYSATRSGEGVLVDFGQVGTQPIVFLSWYTYGTGSQLWLVGSNSFVASQSAVTVELIKTSGASFGDAFRPQDVIRTPWGVVTLRFPTCSTLELTYTPLSGAPGTITMTRALERFGQAQCE